MSRLIVYFDGAARSNPTGPASFGLWCELDDGAASRSWGLGAPLGVRTNNEAEFEALLEALDTVRSTLRDHAHITQVIIRGDSLLVVDAMRGRKRVRAPNLRPLFERARDAHNALGNKITFVFEHVMRAQNTRADKMANRAINLNRAIYERDDV